MNEDAPFISWALDSDSEGGWKGETEMGSPTVAVN